jgi:hypothetical protein
MLERALLRAASRFARHFVSERGIEVVDLGRGLRRGRHSPPVRHCRLPIALAAGLTQQMGPDASHADDDEIDRHDVVQEARDDEDQDPCQKGDKRLYQNDINGHGGNVP